MSQQLFEFLKQDIDNLRNEVRDDMKEIKFSLDEILKFKWQIIGGSVVISAALSVGVSILATVISNKP